MSLLTAVQARHVSNNLNRHKTKYMSLVEWRDTYPEFANLLDKVEDYTFTYEGYKMRLVLRTNARARLMIDMWTCYHIEEEYDEMLSDFTKLDTQRDEVVVAPRQRKYMFILQGLGIIGEDYRSVPHGTHYVGERELRIYNLLM